MNEKQVGQIRRGMIRYLELVIDLSRAASINDMRPVRSAAMFTAASSFIRAFFDENPLSQLGIVVLRDGVAVQVTELSSSPVRACVGVGVDGDGCADLLRCLCVGNAY